MLADIEADRVDLVVVRKIDRLSRSLVHFVQLMEIFERHHVTLAAGHLSVPAGQGHWRTADPYQRDTVRKARDHRGNRTAAIAIFRA